MACRVYRAIKLGFIKDHQNSNFGFGLGSSYVREESGNDVVFRLPRLDESRTTDVELHDHASGKGLSSITEDIESYDRV